MKIEDHYNLLRESLKVIEECIEKGIENRQRTIGFHVSSAATDLLEIFLHKLNLISPGFQLKHNDFSSLRKANLKLPFDFPHKKEILEIMVNIEDLRNKLCYGKPKSKEEIQKIIDLFNELMKIYKKEGVLDEI